MAKAVDENNNNLLKLTFMEYPNGGIKTWAIKKAPYGTQ